MVVPLASTLFADRVCPPWRQLPSAQQPPGDHSGDQRDPACRRPGGRLVPSWMECGCDPCTV